MNYTNQTLIAALKKGVPLVVGRYVACSVEVKEVFSKEHNKKVVNVWLRHTIMVGSKPRVIDQYAPFDPAEKQRLESLWLSHHTNATEEDLRPCDEMSPCVLEIVEWVDERKGKDFQRVATYKGTIHPYIVSAD